MSSNNPSESLENEDCCRNCQHSVDVRGKVEIVCLAFLELRHPTRDSGCCEFEAKRKRLEPQGSDETCPPVKTA